MASGRPVQSKIMRFSAVGLANSAIDLAVFSLAMGLGAHALAANAIGWAVAVVFSYIANSRWSFERDRSLGDAHSALRFFALGAVITLGVSSGAIAALAGLIGPLPAKLIGLAAAAILSFFTARWSIESRLFRNR